MIIAQAIQKVIAIFFLITYYTTNSALVLIFWLNQHESYANAKIVHYFIHIIFYL